MKQYLFIALLLPFLSFAQTKTVKISEQKIGPLNCEYTHKINIESGDTTTYVYIGFRNQKYRQLIEYKSILFPANEKDHVNQFIKDLTTALPEIGSKTQVSWDRDYYSINLFDFGSSLYLYTPDGGANTMLTKKQTESLIAWLKEIGF